MRAPRRLFVTLLLLSLIAIPIVAQAPSEEWMTFETEHYRVHFPAEMEAWARKVTSRLESVREIVGEKIGFETDEVIDVLVMDPMSTANGSAWPFLGRARMVLWASPPDSGSVIGTYNDWVDLVTIHEQAHLTHLLIPSRRGIDRLFSAYTRLGPLMTKSPRWVIEGYATVIEGELTGSGRPQSDLRSAILREWARAGRLPTYGQLSSDSRSFLGMSMAYLTGSAYLEWLQQREGPESLKNLWRRMSARQGRSFSEAFRGVFGESPETLYARFLAELIHEALSLEEEIGPDVQGAEWQDLSWSTSAPDVSPDGSRLVIVERQREGRSKLVVWKTGDDDEAEEKFNERLEKILEKDPLDVAPVLRHPLRRDPEYTLEAPHDVELHSPRWLNGDEIVYVRFEPDSRGVLHPDLFVWSVETGAVRRATRGGDFRDPAPVAGTRDVIAVRNRHGFSQLVRVSLEWGETIEITEPSIDVVASAPSVSPAGDRLAFVEHRSGRWRLVVGDLRADSMTEVTLPEGATVIGTPEWTADGERIYQALGRQGFIEIHEIDVDGSSPVRLLTRSLGASLGPAIGGGERLFFLSLDPDGLDLHVLDPASVEDGLRLPENATPLARPPLTDVVALELEDPGAPEPYGFGRQELSFLTGGGRAAGQETFEAGVRIGDVVGRIETLVIGSISDGRAEGGAILARTQRWPVELGTRIYSFSLEPTFAPSDTPSTLNLEEERTGIEAMASWDRLWRDGFVKVGLSGLFEERGSPVFDDDSLWRAGAEIAGRRRWSPGSMRLGAGGQLLATTSRHDLTGLNAALELGAGTEDFGVLLGGRIAEVDEVIDPRDLIRVGGLQSVLEPSTDQLSRIDEPALSLGSLAGDRYEGVSGELRWGGPLRPFWSAHRAWMDGSGKGDWTELAGLRVSVDIPAMPILAIPRGALELGAAQILKGANADDIEWWLNVRWGN
ncbi:MAG: hypothetical protein KY459_04520 [Acidobacteria bacterium]|nr:hypothetical protein [Acidobacteriota bacterium]